MGDTEMRGLRFKGKVLFNLMRAFAQGRPLVDLRVSLPLSLLLLNTAKIRGITSRIRSRNVVLSHDLRACLATALSSRGCITC